MSLTTEGVRHIGFTGSRDGLTSQQSATLRRILVRLCVPDSVFHFGDCVGADEEAAIFARDVLGCTLHSHPPVNEALRAFVESDFTEPPLPPLTRNRAIVARSELLVACPDEMVERMRSGTWATVRYARKACISVTLVRPDGSTGVELAKVAG